MAADRGVVTTLEFAPSLAIKDLNGAMAAVRHVGRPDHFKLLIDTMHFVRSGSSIADLAAVDPNLIGYAHLSDNTLLQRGAVYREDSQDRMPPGAGEMPLREIIELIPDDVVIGVEVPMQSRAEAGEPTRDWVRRAVEASRALVESVRGRGATD
jgi:sugar phosphate isomerase/epimerase